MARPTTFAPAGAALVLGDNPPESSTGSGAAANGTCNDGVQQRLAALGMLLGRARRAGDQPHGRDLLAQAHEETARVLADVREVVWRVYPAALDQDGLLVAVRALAERSLVPVRVRADLS